MATVVGKCKVSARSARGSFGPWSEMRIIVDGLGRIKPIVVGDSVALYFLGCCHGVEKIICCNVWLVCMAFS